MHLFSQKPDKLAGGVRIGVGEITKHQEAVIQATEIALCIGCASAHTQPLKESAAELQGIQRRIQEAKKGEGVLQREN